MPSTSQKSEDHANSLVFALITVNYAGQVVVALTVQLMVKTVMEPLMSLSVAVAAGAELGWVGLGCWSRHVGPMS
jgi:hypothetical protein